jgi:hypothetical protein
MNILQQYQLLIGIVFAFFLVVFLMIAFFTAPNMTTGQHSILRFLAALCAGFAGALIAGDALFRVEGDTGAVRYFISGTAGFALFFVVWFFFPKPTVPEAPPAVPDRFSASVPKGWTFQHAAKILAQQDNSLVDFGGLKADELNAKLNPTEIETKTAGDAITRLRLITVIPDAIRKYEIRHEDSIYHLIIHG